MFQYIHSYRSRIHQFSDSDVSLLWLVVSTPMKNMKVSWDDEIPNHNPAMFQTTNQYWYTSPSHLRRPSNVAPALQGAFQQGEAVSIAHHVHHTT